MSKVDDLNLSRRDLIKCSGALVITMGLPLGALLGAGEAEAAQVSRTLNPAQLDTWLAIDRDGFVTGYWGKPDLAQGVDTAISQMIAEELDVDVDKVHLVFGDTALTANQGGASGSTGVQRSGVALQAAAAEARLVLLEKAALALEVPVAKLMVTDGVIHESGNRTRSLSYGDVIGDDLLNAPIEWNGKYGNSLGLKGRAILKDPKDYKVIGTSVARKDLADKIVPTAEYLQHLKLPGMLHGRMIRPPVAGAHVTSVDRRSVSHIPGVQVVVEKDFVGVVAPKEWDAVKAAEALKVDWDRSNAGFPTTSEELHDWLRQAPSEKFKIEEDDGDVESVFASSSRLVEAEYEWPFQSHARMAPATGVADVREDHATVWTDSQKPFDTAHGAAMMLGFPVNGARPRPPNNSVRGIFMPGPGSYGRSDAGDGGIDAVILSHAVGAPVRLQWMRDEGHAWDPKGPAAVVTARGSVDASGNAEAYHYHIKGFSRHDQNSRENHPSEILAGHLMGHQSSPEWQMRNPADSYEFPNKRYSWDAVGPLLKEASPLRTAHFRDPYGCEVHFASESFMDELAYACGTDPLEFRLKHVTDPRDADVIRAVADLANWEPHTAARKRKGADGVMVGHGVAYATRNGATNAVVVEVEVTPDTGRIWVRRFRVASDHGLIINPKTLDRTIEGNLLQATSRTLFEEVKFDRMMVTSIDWATYPILEAVDAPEEVTITHINRPGIGPRGAGEATTRIVPAAIANAVFDATGVRMRKAPLTPERVRQALAKA